MSVDPQVQKLLNAVDNRALKLADWNTVLTECRRLACKWYELSTYLGLPVDKIDKIRADNKDSARCLSEALKEWINGNYNTTVNEAGPPSWKTLLSSVAMLDMQMCRNLASKYKAQPKATRKRDASSSRSSKAEKYTSTNSTYTVKKSTASSAHGEKHNMISGSKDGNDIVAGAKSRVKSKELDLLPRQDTDTELNSFSSTQESTNVPQGRSNSVNWNLKRLPSCYGEKSANITHKFKVNVIGDYGVGKSTMLNKVLVPDFKFGDTASTISIEEKCSCFYEYKEGVIELKMIDFPGAEDNFKDIEFENFNNVHGTILMFDVTRTQTLLNVFSDKHCKRKPPRCWIKDIGYRALDDNLPQMIVVGGKIDIKEREVDRETAEQYAKRHKLPYFEVSSKENLGIEEVFQHMVRKLMDQDHNGAVTNYGACGTSSTTSLLPPNRENAPDHRSCCCNCCRVS